MKGYKSIRMGWRFRRDTGDLLGTAWLQLTRMSCHWYSYGAVGHPFFMASCSFWHITWLNNEGTFQCIVLCYDSGCLGIWVKLSHVPAVPPLLWRSHYYPSLQDISNSWDQITWGLKICGSWILMMWLSRLHSSFCNEAWASWHTSTLAHCWHTSTLHLWHTSILWWHHVSVQWGFICSCGQWTKWTLCLCRWIMGMGLCVVCWNGSFGSRIRKV